MILPSRRWGPRSKLLRDHTIRIWQNLGSDSWLFDFRTRAFNHCPSAAPHVLTSLGAPENHLFLLLFLVLWQLCCMSYFHPSLTLHDQGQLQLQTDSLSEHFYSGWSVPLLKPFSARMRCWLLHQGTLYLCCPGCCKIFPNKVKDKHDASK